MLRIPRGRPVGAGPLFEGPAEPGDFVEKQPREQAVVLQAFPGPVLDADDFYAGEVADELFSGMASRLFERVRDQKGLAYFVRSGRIAGRSAAMFYFIAGTQPGKESEVLEEIGAEIARVQSGEVTEEELRRCHVRLKAGHRKALQTNSSRAMQAAVDVLQGRPANDWKRYDSLVDAVGLGDLSRFRPAPPPEGAAHPARRPALARGGPIAFRPPPLHLSFVRIDGEMGVAPAAGRAEGGPWLSRCRPARPAQALSSPWPSTPTSSRAPFDRLSTRSFTVSRKMIERFVSVCGQIGVIAITSARGWMMGPPADRL